MNPVPSMPDGLTPEWLTQVLSTRGVLAEGGEITAVEVEQIGDGVGMMSELARVHLTCSPPGAAPRSIVAKFASQNPTNREVSMDFHVYEREVRYFQELDARTELVSPEMHYAAIEGDEFVLLMEDLEAYRCGDQTAGATLRESELAIDALVRLHAPFWNRVDDLTWVPGVADSYHADNLYNFVQAGWPAMMEHFGQFVAPEIDARRDRFFAAARDLQARMNQAPRTFLHGDFRMENFFYGQEPQHHDIVIFDFQGPLLGKGVVDVALLLCQSTQKEVRRAHERDLVNRYAAGLRAREVDYSDAQAWDDYVEAILYSWLYTGVVSGTLDASNPISFAWMSQMIDRHSTASMDHAVFDRLT
ncbi:MAG: phosphotransferase [Pseudomonadales bacterium]